MTSRLNALLIMGLLAIIVDATSKTSSRFVFPLALLGIVPLAERLGYAAHSGSGSTVVSQCLLEFGT